MKKNKRLIQILLVFAILVSMSFNGAAFADNADKSTVLSLTVDDSIAKALDNTHKIAELDQTIDSLFKQYSDLVNMSKGIQSQLDAISDYTKLYQKSQARESFSIKDQQEMMMYSAMFGPKPPSYTSEDMFDNFIKNRDFPHYAVWAGIQDAKEGKEVAKASISSAIRTLYDQILGLQDAVELQQKLYDVMDKQNDQLIQKYNLGQSSAIDKYVSEVGLQEQKLAVSKLQRTLANVEMAFKQQLGIPLTQEIVLKPYHQEDPKKELPAYEDYLSKALDKRSEVVNGKLDFLVKQRELNIMQEYITDPENEELLDEQQSVDDKSIALTEATNNVTSDIYAGYADLKTKQKDVSIALSKKQNADRLCKNTIIQYNNGVVPLSALWSVELQQTQAEIGYNSAIRDYNGALYKMDMASGVGPAYNTGTGGY